MLQCPETFNISIKMHLTHKKKKKIGKNSVIVKLNTIFCIYIDNNSSRTILSAVLFFPNFIWLSHQIQIPPKGNDQCELMMTYIKLYVREKSEDSQL